MEEKKNKDLESRVSALELERAAMLDELEAVYVQMEEHLSAARLEREIAYQGLRERNLELEQRLAELKKALNDLQETQQMLIRSERLAAMGEMAAAMVHEIRNPLSVIIGSAELLKMGGGDPQKDLERLLKASEYLRDLSHNILQFSRHHRGKASDLDVNALIAKLESLVKPIFKTVELRLALKDGLPSVRVDPNQIEQVIMNLILNALDAVGDRGLIQVGTGTGSIQTAVAEETRKGRYWVLAVETDEEVQAEECVYAEVRDNGPGIHKAHMTRLFESFFTTKGEEKGTGLGLSISRTILSEWGGNILVGSSEGSGTTFKVFLPRLKDKAEDGSERDE